MIDLLHWRELPLDRRRQVTETGPIETVGIWTVGQAAPERGAVALPITHSGTRGEARAEPVVSGGAIREAQNVQSIPTVIREVRVGKISVEGR